MVWAQRIRQRQKQYRDVESPAGCFPICCHREDPIYTSSGPDRILRLFRCKGSKNQSEKRSVKGPWVPFTAQGKHDGGLPEPTPPAPPPKATLEVSEITERSIPKLERLTGAMVVLVPIVATINGDSENPVIHSTTTYGGSTQASTSQWSPDPDVISPLLPSSAYISPTYSNMAAQAQKSPRTTAKRVTFTCEEKIAQHIAAQFYSTRERQYFPQQKSSRYPKRTEKNCHRSWDGRSVLELDDSDSENGWLLGVPRNSLPHRKHVTHVPYTQDYYRIFSNNRPPLPLANTGSAMRLPLQETHQFKNATHLSQTPQFCVAPKIQSMVGDTIYVPVPQKAGSLRLSPQQCGLDSLSITSTIYSFEHMHISEPRTDYRNSVEFGGLSPPPPLPLSSLPPAYISGMIASAALGAESGLRASSSPTSQSMADTVLTEGTVGSTDTLTTEKEIALEMERIRERAKRASIERKARRAEEERKGREEKGKGKGKEREHNG